MMMPDLGRRRRVARADARRAHDAHARHRLALQRARAAPRRRPACSSGCRTRAPSPARRPRLAVRHHIEVRVEGRDLVHLGHRDLEHFGQRVQVARRQAAFLVLDQMQVLDQQRALARPLAQQRLDGRRLVLPAAPGPRERRRLAPARARMDRAAPDPSLAVGLGLSFMPEACCSGAWISCSSATLIGQPTRGEQHWRIGIPYTIA